MKNFSIAVLVLFILLLLWKLIYSPKVVEVTTERVVYKDTLVRKYDSLLVVKSDLDSILNKQILEYEKLKRSSKTTRDSIMLIGNSVHSVWFDEWTERLFKDSTFISNKDS